MMQYTHLNIYFGYNEIINFKEKKINSLIQSNIRLEESNIDKMMGY